MMPAGFFAPSPGTPLAGAGRGGDGAGSAAAGTQGGLVSHPIDAEAEASGLVRISRGSAGALGSRMIMAVWRGWAWRQAVQRRRVNAMR